MTKTEDIIGKYPELNLKKIEIQKVMEKTVEPEFQKIYNVLSFEKTLHIDEIVKMAHMKISEANYKLMMLELEGKVEMLPGNYYKKI